MNMDRNRAMKYAPYFAGHISRLRDGFMLVAMALMVKNRDATKVGR